MMLQMQLLQPFASDVCIDLCRRYVRMAEEQLNNAQVRSVVQEMSGESVPQGMR